MCATTAARLAEVPIAAIYASPIERTRQTAEHIASHHDLEVDTLEGVIEADYGEWTGGKLADHGDGTYTYTFGTNITAITTPIAN